jgi:hypothetical protein
MSELVIKWMVLYLLFFNVLIFSGLLRGSEHSDGDGDRVGDGHGHGYEREYRLGNGQKRARKCARTRTHMYKRAGSRLRRLCGQNT